MLEILISTYLFQFNSPTYIEQTVKSKSVIMHSNHVRNILFNFNNQQGDSTNPCAYHCGIPLIQEVHLGVWVFQPVTEDSRLQAQQCPLRLCKIVLL